jgi:hypothetical protein
MISAQKTVAIVQSNYIPWKGYFDLINQVDEFILFDDVQYTRRDWRNRNKIKTRDGSKWLTIPVEVKGKYHQKINETRISETSWGNSHFETLRANYKNAPFFRQYKDMIESLYIDHAAEPYLSVVNLHFLQAICSILGIHTPITWSSNYQVHDGKNERLVALCKQAGAQHYVSGPAAKVYLDETLFAQEGITLSFMDYSGYPEYPQLFPPFEHEVSILDLIFNAGQESPRYMKSF